MMASPKRAPIKPLFLEGPAGPIFAVYHAPPARLARGFSLLYLPPFAEEMNCSRRVVALQARRLAEIGVGVLLLDPYGTGDSGGDFREADWEIWLGDANAATAWLRSHTGGEIGLWGLRLGALLALRSIALQPGAFRRVLLWQPVVDGHTMLTQFLRLRLAGNLAGDGASETTRTMRQKLAAGEPLEVAGYEVPPNLAAAIDATRMGDLEIDVAGGVDWVEVVPEPSRGLTPASLDFIKAWRDSGVKVRAETVDGEPFWMIQETVLAPALLDATIRLLTQ